MNCSIALDDRVSAELLTTASYRMGPLSVPGKGPLHSLSPRKRGPTRKLLQYLLNPICCSHVCTSVGFQLETVGRIRGGTSSPIMRSVFLASDEVVVLVE